MILIRRIIYVAAYFVYLSFGCRQHTGQGEVIKINPYEAKEEIKLSEFVDTVKYIRLETDSACILGRVSNIFIREKYIYAIDLGQQRIFVFDKKGKYVTKLDKQGRGPGEYLLLGPTIVDDHEEFIEIVDYKKILKYSSPPFNLLEKRPFPFISAIGCMRQDDIYYFETHQIKNIVNEKPTNASILVVKNDKVEKKLFEQNTITQNSAFSVFSESLTRNDKGELFVSIMWDNTFYKLHDMNAYPILTVDFGKYGIDNSIGKESVEKQLKYIETTTGLASFPVLNMNNSDLMAFSYFLKQKADSKLCYNADFYQYIKLKNSNKTFHTKRIVNDITSFPREVYLSISYRGVSIAHEVWYKGFLVDIVPPGEYFLRSNKTKEKVEGLGEVTIDDNPIIILMKLKENL